MYLSDTAHGRDNNFNLIRAVAATAVLVSHAWPLTLGPGTPEPFQALTGQTLGSLAVYVFFATSGFLIATSFARRPDPWAFLAARALRLLPGLFVSLLLVAYAMGPLVTALPAADYLADPAVSRFVLRNMALVSPAYGLPGVFAANPYPAVEGSIWTLAYEVVCYLGVLAAGLLGAFRDRRWMAACLAVYGAVWGGLWLVCLITGQGIHPRIDDLHRLSLPFATGVLIFVLRDRLVLSARGLLVVWAVWGLARIAVSAAADPALVAALAYSTFWLAYVPRGPLLAYNRLGDYSYGIYIYAFPLQGLMVWLFGPMAPWTNIALALPAVLVCAVLSWHLVEAPALTLRHRWARRRST